MTPLTSRKAAPSPLRRTSLTVLVVGTALAILAAAGPEWLARIGVVLAVATGVLACGCAWREIRHNRRQHAGELLAATRRHGEALTEERRHNTSVVNILAERATVAQAEVERQRITIGGMQVEISTLRHQMGTLQQDNARLTEKLAQRDSTVKSLTETVRSHEAELLVLRHREIETVPPAEAPAVLDPRTWETALILPNYEVDHRSFA